ncbi:hypothetical protein OG481_02140 [Streptomyces longwoodensis]|uniref:hypothetical protein n=1 Tax=Streptomyces longwoodensis TaxID=68231 RepID=UPI002DD8EE5C|nr:hypothetical protein [Streptomyces longwoodensis]WRY87393.1 hypothetical protein OG481_02140 [Streptomyces longwoodensis]
MPYVSRDLISLTDDHAEAALALEQETADAAVGSAEKATTALVTRMLTAWVAAFGSPDTEAGDPSIVRRLLASARAAVRRVLDQLAVRAENVLTTVLPEALALGVRQAGETIAAAAGRPRRASAVRPGRELAAAAGRVAEMVRERRDRALALLHPDRVSRWSDVLTGLGAARGAVAAVRAQAALVVHTGANDGGRAVADAAGLGRLWVAEADACVNCLAYAGRVAPVGTAFPGGLSWDPRQRRTGAPVVQGPPLHPNCRCRAVPWSVRWTSSGLPFPEAVRREAERAIGYGRARSSESRAARVRAARELLRIGDDLLPDVEARARAAASTGRFPAAA